MPQTLGDEEMVTQYVFEGSAPRNRPREVDTDGLSCIRGQQSVTAMARLVRTRTRLQFPGDDVRCANVGDLRSAGFEVVHTPTRRNPLHVSIAVAAEWTAETERAFDACFSRPANAEPGGVTP